MCAGADPGEGVGPGEGPSGKTRCGAGEAAAGGGAAAEGASDYALKPGSDIGSGKAHDPEKKALADIIQALNDLFGAEVSDADQVQFLHTIVQRIRRQEDVMNQVNNHSAEQAMHGLFPKRIVDTVLDAMTDHEKLSLEVLDNAESARKFALLVLKILTTANHVFARSQDSQPVSS
jgi:type I restriction enzyme, R subunit